MSLWWIRAWRLPGPLMGAGLGLILGLSALTHPNAALYAGGLTGLWVLRVLFGGASSLSRRVSALVALLPGASLALLFLFPFAETVSAWGGFAGRKLAMNAASPFDLRFVTIWPLAALTALPHWRRWPTWKRALAVLCLSYTVAAVAQSLWGLETERLRVLSRLHRFAPLFFILNGAFAVEGMSHLIRALSHERRSVVQLATLFLLGVSFQQACALNAPKKRSLSALLTLPAGSQKAERLLADLRAHGLRPDKGEHRIEGVLLFPEKKRRGHRLAALSGLNVYFYHNQFIPFAAAEKKIASRRERRRKLRGFYRGLKAGRLNRRFLKRAHVRYFYSDTKLSSAKHAVTRLFSWERGAIYRVDPPNQLKRAEVAGALPSEASVSSAKSATRAAQKATRARERGRVKVQSAERSRAAEAETALGTRSPPATSEGERRDRPTEIEIDRRYPPPPPPVRVGEALHPPASAVKRTRAPGRAARPALVPAAAVGAALQVGFQQGLRAKGGRTAKAAPRRKTRAGSQSKRRGARRGARTPSARRATRQRTRQAEQRARIKRSRQAAARRRARRTRRARQASKRRGGRDRTEPPRRRPDPLLLAKGGRRQHAEHSLRRRSGESSGQRSQYARG